jgi:hypothetical protein
MRSDGGAFADGPAAQAQVQLLDGVEPALIAEGLEKGGAAQIG